MDNVITCVEASSFPTISCHPRMIRYGLVSEDTMRTMTALASTALLCGGVALTVLPAQAAPKDTAQSKSQTPAQAAQPRAAKGAAKTRKSSAARDAKAAAQKAAAQRRPAAQGDDDDDDDDNGYIIRGQDAVGMVAMLPWWRSNDQATIIYLHKAVASPVLTAAGRWRRTGDPAASDPAGDDRTDEEKVEAVWATVNATVNASARSALTAFAFADPRQVFDAETVVKAPPQPNDRVASAIKAQDRNTTPSPPPPPAERTWLQSFFGLISSAFSALF
jgi:hypothetical protein